ncbi:hypothetical protein [Vibrio salinus]|uniref:hypothetical protein n=1 Tax=Vibrio salinus TaxID=2899784 RepID=UPI001E32F16C|nr:hypothetical protein [Vibrio salinus]MCE0495565.1 hypothetical protein [Vibrio salinus]
MKIRRYFKVFLLILLSLFSQVTVALPAGTQGILTVEKMTQGELLWLKGRIGDATYTLIKGGKETCTVKIPVAVGSKSDTGLGISETKGLTIFVMSKSLSDALIHGKRINSEDWHFSTREQDTNADGVVIEGIKTDEEFVLNSRRRWISWLMGKSYDSDCAE